MYILISSVISLLISLFQVSTDSIVVGKEQELFDIEDVVLHEKYSIILTGNEPYLHVYQDGKVHTFGRQGRGPFEMVNPGSSCTDGSAIYVLDFQPGNNRLLSFSFSGDRSLDEIELATSVDCNDQSGIISGVKMRIGSEGQINRDGYFLYKMDDLRQIMEFKSLSSVRVTNKFSIRPPFRASPRWTFLSDGGFAFWDGESDNIELLTLNNKKMREIPLPNSRIKLREKDIEFWLDDNYSTETTSLGFGLDVSAIRDGIKTTIEFPEYFPVVETLKGDPEQGIWIRRARQSDGEIWTWIRELERATYKFPDNRKIVSVGKEKIALKVQNKDGFEFLEIYKKEDLDEFLINGECYVYGGYC